MMEKTQVLFSHGLEGSPQGRKATALREAGFTLICPDCNGFDLAKRVLLHEPFVQAADHTQLIGSSYGGLVALYLATTYPEKITGLLLCAPAFQREEIPMMTIPPLPSTIPCVIIHGINDTIVKPEVSQQFARLNPHIELMLVEDNHRLKDSTDLIVKVAQQLYQR